MVALLKQLLVYLAAWIGADHSPQLPSDLLAPGAVEVAQHSGQVPAGNFTRFQVSGNAGLSLQLLLMPLTDADDPDLFVSVDGTAPDLDRYSFKAASFGVDSVLVPSGAPRPFTVGVFGGRSFMSSRFLLKLYALPRGADDRAQPREHVELTGDQAPEDGSYDALAASEPTSADRQRRRASSQQEPSSRDTMPAGDAALVESLLSFLLKLVTEVLL